jgi:DNA-binding LacI/PurR family transcriptional regulator
VINPHSGQKKKTIRISFDQRSRTVAVMRALIRSGFFHSSIPSEIELARQLHLPRTYISFAFDQLSAEGLIHRSSVSSPWQCQSPGAHNGSVAMVVNTNPLEGWQAVFLDFFIGFEEVMHSEQYDTELVGNFTSHQEKVEKVASLRESGCMGFALASRAERPVLDMMLENRIPTVIVGNATLYEENFGCVCTDNAAGINKAIDFACSLGHEDIGFYSTGLSFHNGFRLRYEQYLQQMRQRHLKVFTATAYPEPHHDLSSRRAAETLLRMDKKPSIVLCASDREAFELCSELKHQGIRVPDDVSVIGFDNNYYAQLLNPPITTVDIYAVNMGQTAAHYLLNEMLAPQFPVKICLPTEIIQRSTVANRQPKEPPPDPVKDPSGLLTF